MRASNCRQYGVEHGTTYQDNAGTSHAALDIEHRNGWECVLTVALPRGSTSTSNIDVDTGNAVEMTGRDRCSPPHRDQGSSKGAIKREGRVTAMVEDIWHRALRTLLQPMIVSI